MATAGQRLAHRKDFSEDERWQLVQRIAASPAFQKSARLRELLIYLAGHALSGSTDILTEQKIGRAVMGKSPDYSPLEDSSVRVHVRQLRLKLHEYFDSCGQPEPLALEIPRGSYVPLFHYRKLNGDVPGDVSGKPQRQRTVRGMIPWVIVGVLAVLCSFFFAKYRAADAPQGASPSPAASSAPPWPLSEVFNRMYGTDIVAADANYGMLCIVRNSFGTLQDYLSPGFPKDFLPVSRNAYPSLLIGYIQASLLTSFADVANATKLLRLAGPYQNHVRVLSARDLRLRDLDAGNYIFLGSDTSNPWVSLFEARLNFVEVAEKVIGGKYFLNRKPFAGEQRDYPAQVCTADACTDYATISLLPNQKNNGNILILQGLQQEGTEAAGDFLTNPNDRRELYRALGYSRTPGNHVYLEALIRTQAIASAPSSITLVATRLIH
ncbi:MAG: hypothetical protein ACRD3O_09115 [Terriglobia bacterium]